MITRSALAFSPGAAGPALADDDEIAWQDLALCAETDPEAFFPDKGGSTREAKRLCRSCEVQLECLGYALKNGERFGIWGGMSERERRRVARSAVTTGEILAAAARERQRRDEDAYRKYRRSLGAAPVQQAEAV